MAYTPVPTKNTGDLWSADDNNTYIRDNFAAGVPDIFTAKGDLAVATAADTATRLALGSTGQFLIADSSRTCGVKWGAAGTGTIYIRYKVNAVQSIANNTGVILNFGTKVFDTVSGVTTGASWKYTVPAGKGGYFLVSVGATLESNAGWGAGEFLKVLLFKNSTSYTAIGYTILPAAGTYAVSANGATVISATDGDDLFVKAWQTSGGAINIDSDPTKTHIAIARLL